MATKEFRKPTYQKPTKKSREQMLLEMIGEQQRQINIMRNDMRLIIEDEIKKYWQDGASRVDAALMEAVVMKEVFIELGLVTRDQINAKYLELKSKVKNG